MSYILGFDASQFQGMNISFPQVEAAGYLFGISRATYAYPGQAIRIDPSFNRNYYSMVSAGIAPGGYHKVGWTDPIAEADAFLAAMSPLAAGDLLAHDMEPATDVAIPSNWSAWEQSYVQRLHDRSGVWSIRYENISMNNSMPKQGVVTNCASWVAAPSYSWDANVPVNTPVVIQQGPTVHIPGITANVCDTDAFFGSGTPDELLAEIKKLGYQPAAPAPSPPPPPTPIQDVTPPPPPAPIVINPTPVEPTPEPGQGTTPPTPDVTPVTPAQSWISKIINLLKRIFGVQ